MIRIFLYIRCIHERKKNDKDSLNVSDRRGDECYLAKGSSPDLESSLPLEGELPQLGLVAGDGGGHHLAYVLRLLESGFSRRLQLLYGGEDATTVRWKRQN